MQVKRYEFSLYCVCHRTVIPVSSRCSSCTGNRADPPYSYSVVVYCVLGLLAKHVLHSTSVKSITICLGQNRMRGGVRCCYLYVYGSNRWADNERLTTHVVGIGWSLSLTTDGSKLCEELNYVHTVKWRHGTSTNLSLSTSVT